MVILQVIGAILVAQFVLGIVCLPFVMRKSSKKNTVR